MISAGLLAQSLNNSYQRDDLQDSAIKSLQESAKGPMTPEKAKKVAHEFEAMFISQMLQHMMSDSAGEDAFGGGETDEIYKSMMVDEYGKAITKSGGIGIAAHIERTLTQRALLQTQEVAHADQTQQ